MIDKNSLDVRGNAKPTGPPCFRTPAKWCFLTVMEIASLAGLVVAAEGPTPSLDSSGILALQQRCGSGTALKESFQLTRTCALGGPGLAATETLAFEENPLFIYALGNAKGNGQAEESPPLVRRFFLLKPNALVIDDRVQLPVSGKPPHWLLDSRSLSQRGQVRVGKGNNALFCETLFTGAIPQGDSSEVRFLHVLHISNGDDLRPTTRSKLVEQDGQLSLTVTTAERVFQLTLPAAADAAGRVAISTTDGEELLAGRPLPSGVLPHGPQGVQLLKRWDAAYHHNRRPGWDTGRPSSNLEKAVDDGTLKPCRAVVLGCGTGTNAIYLAKRGFEVTGIDIAPTALIRAKAKADKAGVEVRWLLASVLAPPREKPFELIFDRGCYHGVRRQNAAGYVEAVARLSQPGTRVLILAGNANESRPYGPPRVKEEEIRGDFSKSFEFQWLRETQFDTMEPNGKGALAWSVLLRKK